MTNDGIRYRTIVADPPWRFDDSLPGRGRGAAKHYRTLSTPDIIKAYPLLDFEVERDARLFLWRVTAMQQAAWAVMKAWGFVLKSEVVWVKVHGENQRLLHMGMGRQVRMSHEVCLIGTRGRPERLSAAERSVIFAETGAHSEKPAAFYELVERLSPGPYLELFARRPRVGWTCLGDEL
jgi:N6-adenosine-specific RNA methylase IME4